MPPRRLSKKTLRAVQKYGPTVDDIAQQYGISGTALLAKLVVGESGDNASAVSPAGAKGRTQFMPSSRQIAVQKYGVDPWKDEDQAVHAAALHLRGKINGTPGLEGYNPGMASYPSYILNQQVGDVRGSVRRPRAPEGPQRASQPSYRTETTPGVDNSGLRRQLVGEFLQQGGVKNPNAVLGLVGSYGQAADVPGTTTRVPLAGQPKVSRTPKSSSSGALNALSWAESKVGQPGSRETRGENRGRLADYANQRFGMSGQPWCAMFTSLAVTKGGAPKSARTASVAEVRRKALEGDGYQRGLVEPRRAKAGDLVLFGDRHIGMVKSVDGDTIRYVGGNQSDSVTIASTPADGVDVVRPKYGRRKK